MDNKQIKRLIIVVVVAVLYAVAAIWFHSIINIPKKVMAWVVAILFPICAVGILFIVLSVIQDISMKIYYYIKDGHNG